VKTSLQRSERKLDPRWLPILTIGGYLLLNLLVVGLPVDFPLNDDWMYGLEVKKLLETGQLHLLGGGPSCAVHILLGALVCRLSGFSFLALHWLALCIAFAACLLLYKLLVELGAPRRNALFGAFVLACNPLFVNLTSIYMTDTPNLMYVLAYALLLAIGLRKRSVPFCVLSAVCLICAIAVRQNSAVFVAGNLLVAVLCWFGDRKLSAIILLALVAAPALFAYFVDHMMVVVNDYPAAYDWYKEELARLMHLAIHKPPVFALLESFSTVRAAAYLGLFSAPLLVGFIAVPGSSLVSGGPRIDEDEPATTGKLRKDILFNGFISVILALCGMTFFVAFRHELMPFSPNLLRYPSLGSTTMIVGAMSQHAHSRVALTAAAGACAAVLLFAIICSAQRTVVLILRAWKGRRLVPRVESLTKDTAAQRISRAAVCASIVSIAGVSFAWAVLHTTIANLDRYFLLPLTLVIPCTLLAARWLRVRVLHSGAVVVAALIACYSTAAQHDYMSWNRARWQAISELINSGVKSEQIDGGIEFNYLRDPALSDDLVLGPNTFVNVHRGAPETAKLRWWSIHGEQYIVSLTAVPGYAVKGTYPYWSALALKQKQVYLLQRQ
jgi:hypothetical protein